MKLFRRGQHAGYIPVTTRPAPPDTTRPLAMARVSLLQDPATVTFAHPALTAPPQPRALPAPLHSPSSVPPLRPAPPPQRPRSAWIPAQPPPPRPPIRITEPALLACPGGRIPAALTLPCGCHRVHTHGATSSFALLYAEAERAGWRQDTFGTWACPACQEQPGWRAPCTPVLCREYLEAALIRDVAARAAPRWRWRRALRTPRVLLDAKALRKLKPERARPAPALPQRIPGATLGVLRWRANSWALAGPVISAPAAATAASGTRPRNPPQRSHDGGRHDDR